MNPGVLEKQLPLGHPGTPEDVGHAGVSLASDGSRLMTGAALLLDDGSTAQ